VLKKLVVVGGAAVLLLGLLFGREACSYIRTSAGWVKQTVKENVPVEFELERARRMIRELDPEIRRNMTLIAREEVGVKKLADNITEAEKELALAKADILKLKDDLKSDSAHYVYAGRTYSIKQVKSDLEHRFERYRTKDEATEHLCQVLDARRTTLQAAREKLESMMAAKSQLEVDIESLEARLKMVQVAETRSEFRFDDSHLARTKDLLADITARIDVAAKLVDADEYYHEQIPVNGTPESAEDISERITEFFGEREGVESLAGAK